MATAAKSKVSAARWQPPDLTTSETPPQPSPGVRQAGLDGLRAIAILLVLLFHSTNFFTASEVAASYLLRFARTGWNGVTLFFVLSGYLVGGLALQEWRQHAAIRLWRFWGRRAFRTWPLYFLLLALFLGRQRSSVVEPALWHFLTFTQNFFPVAFFTQTWSLAVEEQFYAVLPLVLNILGKARLQRWLWLVTLAGIGAAGAYRGLFGRSTALISVMDALLVGFAIAHLRQTQNACLRILTATPNITLLAGLALVYGPLLGDEESTAAAVLVEAGAAAGFGLILIAALGEPLIHRVLAARLARFVATVSYGAYLTHDRALIQASRLAQTMQLQGAAKLLVIETFGIMGACLLGYACYKLVEQPCLRWRDRSLPPA